MYLEMSYRFFSQSDYDVNGILTCAKRYNYKTIGISGTFGNQYIKVHCPDGVYDWARKFKYASPHTYKNIEIYRHRELHEKLINKLKEYYKPTLSSPPKYTAKICNEWPKITIPVINTSKFPHIDVFVREDENDKFNSVVLNILRKELEREPDPEKHLNFDLFRGSVIGEEVSRAFELNEEFFHFDLKLVESPQDIAKYIKHVRMFSESGLVVNVVDRFVSS